MNIINTYEFLKNDLDPNKSYIIFCRHGQSVVNEEERVGGSSDLANKPLTKKGEAEAEDLGRNLAPFKDKITQAFTSPLIRAHQTGKTVLKTMGSGILLQEEPALREKFFGEELDGQTKDIYEHYAAIERDETKGVNFSQKWAYTCSKLTKVESFAVIFKRVREFMLAAAKKYPGEVILAFGHKVSSIKVPVMGVLHEEGIELDYRAEGFNEPKNGAAAVYEIDPETAKIRLVAIDGFSLKAISI